MIELFGDGPPVGRTTHWAATIASPLEKLGHAAARRRRGVWLALAVVVVPLTLLLGFQYLWLVALERNSAIAHLATLNKQLEMTTKEIVFHLFNSGERILRVPYWLFTQPCECYDKYFADHAEALDQPPKDPAAREAWLALPGQGARMFFLASFVGTSPGKLVAFDVRRRARVPEAEIPPAARVAVYYWQLRAHKAPASITPKDLVPDESDAANPMILCLVADERSRVVGITGMILDTDFFAKEVLPVIVRRALPADTGRANGGPVASVWNGAGQQVFATPGLGQRRVETKRKFPFILTSWTIGLGSAGSSGAQLARTNFYLNLTLAVVLASVLLGGVVFVMRSAAREMRLSQMKSEFVSNVSHELRTPISSIRVFGELMRLGRVEDLDKVREYGEYIECEGRRLSRLIDNILDFSRIEAGRKVYRSEDHDLADVTREVLCALDVRLRREGFAVELKVPAEPLPPVRIDSGAIAHALTNLLDNAAKYSGGSRRILVTLAAEARDVSVSVRDYGIGIPPEDHQRIFDRFHRAGSVLVHDVKGVGLGLAIVSHIIQAHGGRVTLTSAPGEGSAFTIHLPIAPTAREANGRAPASVGTATSDERSS